MANVGRVEVDIVANTQEFRNSMTNVRNSINEIRNTTSNATSSIVSGFKAVAVAIGAIELAKFGKEATNMALSVERSIERVNFLFGKNAQEMYDWGTTNGRAMGMSREEVLKYSHTYGNLLSAITKDTGKLTEYTKQLLKSSAVVASATGRDMTDVMERIRSGILGKMYCQV